MIYTPIEKPIAINTLYNIIDIPVTIVNSPVTPPNIVRRLSAVSKGARNLHTRRRGDHNIPNEFCVNGM